MTRRTPLPVALAVALLGMTGAERALVLGSLEDALRFAAGAQSAAVVDAGDEDGRETVRPGGGV